MKNLRSFFIMFTGVLVVGASCGRDRGSDGLDKSARSPAKDEKPTVQTTPVKPATELCKAHGAPTKICFICDPALREAKRLWCREHNRYEDRCFECHPEAQDKSRLYCKEHSLYEDECMICHPELLSQTGSAPSGERRVSGAAPRCGEHNLPEEECGICHPDLLGSLKPGEGLKIRFESPQSAGKAGVSTELPDSAFAKGGVSYPARTAFNENASAVVSTRFSGTITAVNVDLGATVRKGQILATISSPEFAQLIAEYRSAEKETHVRQSDYLREKALYEMNVSLQKDFDNVAAAFNRAHNTSEALRQRLADAGLTPGDLTALLEQVAVSSGFAVRAPAAGTITRRSAAPGQSVGSESAILTIIDLYSLWVHVSVPASMGMKVMPGESLRITFDGNSKYPATVNWVSPEIDQASGMIQVRAELKNPDGGLKSGMFCRAFVAGEKNGRPLAVPSDAMANIDGNDVVFTKVEPDLFEIRRVSLDGIIDEKAIISQGLALDDQVVVNGTFVVKSEFLKSRLGAGCVDE